jgi:hypothetical protein
MRRLLQAEERRLRNDMLLERFESRSEVTQHFWCVRKFVAAQIIGA